MLIATIQGETFHCHRLIFTHFCSFGHILCVRTMKDISADEELFVKVRLNGSFGPSNKYFNILVQISCCKTTNWTSTKQYGPPSKNIYITIILTKWSWLKNQLASPAKTFNFFPKTNFEMSVFFRMIKGWSVAKRQPDKLTVCKCELVIHSAWRQT